MSGIFGGSHAPFENFNVATKREYFKQDQDLAAYIKDHPEASALLGAYRDITYNPANNQPYGEFPSPWMSNGNSITNFDSLISQYNAYKSALDTQRKDHAAYVKLVNERPGRSALMTVDHVNPLAPTDPSKTVLG